MNYFISLYLPYRFSDLPLKEAEIRGSNILSLLWLTSVIASPIFGIVVDKFGIRSKLSIISALIGIAGYILGMYIYPVLPTILIGI